MTTVVKARIVRMGNSQGVRIPKTVLEQLGFGQEVEMAVEFDQLVIRSAHHQRRGWDEQFRAMAARHDDQLSLHLANTWDEQEWQW